MFDHVDSLSVWLDYADIKINHQTYVKDWVIHKA